MTCRCNGISLYYVSRRRRNRSAIDDVGRSVPEPSKSVIWLESKTPPIDQPDLAHQLRRRLTWRSEGSMNHLALRPTPSRESDTVGSILRNETSHVVLTRSSARYMFAVKISAPAPCYIYVSMLFDTVFKKAYEFLSEEILLKRTLSSRIVLQCDISICTEGAGKHSNIAEHWFTAQKGESCVISDDKINFTEAYPEYLTSCTRNSELRLQSPLARVRLFHLREYSPRGLIKFKPYFPFNATISPQAPPTLELISNAFHKW